ncbi:fragile X mental retardation 1 neighbor protein [Fukomys damarensis]|uniref:fragile X mental retardation 1 neighbor protein n=1 Tax=Fukomys damarensis TaxID=885580 RepID=UPI001455BB1F|nr:fragile X mental retardation 1 neighbor protein [Fukomys damarensis]
MPSSKGRGRARRLKKQGVKVTYQKQKHSEPKEVVANRPSVAQATMAGRRHQERRSTALRELAARLHSVLKMWVFRFFLISILFVWGVLLFNCFKFGLSESVPLNEDNLRNSEVSDKSLEETSIWEVLSDFFLPTTCMVKENQEVTPCNEMLNHTELQCLKSKCCFSTSATRNCFMPFIDKSTQVSRIFGFSVLTLIFLGCMPLCCYCLFQRSQFANALRMRTDRILKALRKREETVMDSTEMLERAAEEEEDAVDEEKESTSSQQ